MSGSDSESSHSGGSSSKPTKNAGAKSPLEIGNPLYCSYIEGVYTYKDPNTKNEYTWDEITSAWTPKIFNGYPVVRNIETKTFEYTDSDGTCFEFDTNKNAWFPKRGEAGLSASTASTSNQKQQQQQPPSSSSSTVTASASASSKELINQQISSAAEGGGVGFSNPNYSQPRRFYYAALSPESMGVEFLSPDVQMNNNSQIPEDPTVVPLVLPLGQHLQSQLPSGWEKHEDAKGPYYWHIKSGTIQRDPPPNPALSIPSGKSHSTTSLSTSNNGSCSSSNVLQPNQSQNLPTTSNAKSTNNKSASSKHSTKTPSQAPFIDNKQLEEEREKNQMSSSSTNNTSNWANFLDRSQSSSSSSSSPSNNSLRFIAISLGFLPISEEDLTPERSSKAVSKVIHELTSCKSEFAGKIWNTLSEICLELDESHLRVRNDSMILQEQPIHSIRVWGVGREDTRDFAFVSREKKTRQFLCHVFRLEMNARPLASALRDACKRIMIERQKKNKRPDSLPMSSLMKKSASMSSAGISGSTAFFPTPMDEPRKIIKASYLGAKLVPKPSGIDLLNSAIDTCLNSNEKIPVSVSVAPSVIQIESEDPIRPLNLEIRVRFLSFMGIGADCRTCGVIVHTANDAFEAHCFFSNPSSGALCKAIEAACVLRYQKCLDSHHRSDSVDGTSGSGGANGNSSSASTTGPAFNVTSPTSLASAFKNVLGVFTRKNSTDDK